MFWIRFEFSFFPFLKVYDYFEVINVHWPNGKSTSFMDERNTLSHSGGTFRIKKTVAVSNHAEM
jgi:hypothetical protein